jgi:hypothetical protein
MTSPRYRDGRLHEVPLTDRARIEYPFLANPLTPDAATRILERRFCVDAWRYVPRLGSTPVTDSAENPSLSDRDSLAYLVAESEKPEYIGGGRYAVTRRYARIPGTQYEPDSVALARPSLHDIKVTVSSVDYYAVSFDDGATSHLFTTGRKAVSTVADILGGTRVAVAAEAFGTLPSASVTFAEGANSVSVNLTSSASSIQSSLATALTGLTSVSVAGTGGSLTVSWVGTMESISTSSTAVTMSGGAGADGSVTFTAAKPSVEDVQTLAAPTRIITTSSAHGGSAGDWLACWNGNKLVGMVKVVAASGSSITVPAGEGLFAVDDVAITHVGFMSAAAYRVANGQVECSARRVRRFYLPGVTVGITNAADIPGFASVTSDPISWLTAIVPQLTSPSEDRWAVHSTERLASWQGPILEKAVVEIQLQDAVQSLAVGA